MYILITFIFILCLYIIVYKLLQRLSPQPIQERAIGYCNKMKCISKYEPVCGSDGITYENSCTFGQVSCKEPGLKIVKYGECDNKDSIDSCDVKSCPKNYDPVCGSDGKKYTNKCLYNQALCRQPDLQIVKCEEAPKPKPKPKFTPKPPKAPVLSDCKKPCNSIAKPVCGSDGNTYGNLCSLMRSKCSNPKLKLLYSGLCKKINN